MLNTSVAKKIAMAVSGLFLVSFILLHLSINLTLIWPGREAFEKAVHFMGTNIFIRIMEPILFAGFLFHIGMGIYLEWKNYGNRPEKYQKYNASAVASWASRNMIWTGLLLLVFLIVHFYNYYVPFRYGEVHSHYDLVTGLFKNPFYTILYILAFVALGFHLSHGFESALQSLGYRREKYHKYAKRIGNLIAFVVAAGFSLIAIYFYFN